jgi:hypothetical protein
MKQLRTLRELEDQHLRENCSPELVERILKEERFRRSWRGRLATLRDKMSDATKSKYDGYPPAFLAELARQKESAASARAKGTALGALVTFMSVAVATVISLLFSEGPGEDQVMVLVVASVCGAIFGRQIIR